MIICGYNEITKDIEGVFVDTNVPEGENFIRGDPADVEVLKRAGIEGEEKIIIALESDEKSIFVALLARELNPGIRMAAIVKKDENVGKMYRAGADYVILESEILAREILRHLLSPRVASFMQKLTLSRDLQLVGVKLPDDYVGKKIEETDIRKRIGTIVAIKRGEKLIRNPAPSTVLKEGDILFFLMMGKEINKISGLMERWILHRD